MQDTQFYMWFVDKELDIKLNPAEFVDAKWLTVEDALNLYCREELSLFVP